MSRVEKVGMIELTETNAAEFLVRTGRLRSRTAVRPLGGGVSNVVLYVDASPVPFVLKQSRPQLRTRDPWFSSLDRIYREADALRALRPLLGAVVPELLFEDRENYLLAMSAAPAGAVSWKSELLAGQFDPTLADRAGGVLATIHEHGVGCTEWRRQFADVRNFHELRLEPYYLRLSQRAPDLAKAIGRLVEETTATRLTLVHADFSPKNMLIAREGGKGDSSNLCDAPKGGFRQIGPVPFAFITLVDYETVHFGDPAFDLGFFLAHLVLKAIYHAPLHGPMLELIAGFCRAYLAGVTRAWGERVVARSLPHLAANLLVRIDGTSPVDYLAESHREVGRRFARWLFSASCQDWEFPIDHLRRLLI
jgi:aminoglycoside phosphotransferase (APT) family kinase protein